MTQKHPNVKPTSPKNPPNDNCPHQAVILISAEIMERLPNGMVTGVPKESLNKIFTVLGKTKQECSDNLAKFLDKIIKPKEEI